MVGESAAAIMAGRRQARTGHRWPLLAAMGAIAIFLATLVTVVATRPRAVSAPTVVSLRTTGLSPGSAEAAAAQGALTAYYGYLDAYAAAGQTADPLDPRLERYAADAALIQVRVSLRTMAQNGLAYRGRFRGPVRVTAVSLATRTVSLVNCQDISALRVVERSTGRPAANSLQSLRFPVVAQARYFEGRWIIVEANANRSRPC